MEGEGDGGGGLLDARERLNRQRRRNDFDPNRVLDREELESWRPDIKPWDINPEFVPKGSNYYEVGGVMGGMVQNYRVVQMVPVSVYSHR